MKLERLPPAIVVTGIICATLTNMIDGFKLGAFNVQVFGGKKASNQAVMKDLAKVVRRYDIVLIQEIRDKSGQAVESLLREVNKYSGKKHKYRMIISDRLGSTSSKEQYAFFYRTSLGIEVVDSYHAYNEVKSVTFERVPFVVRFNIPQLVVSDVAMVAIHTDPDNAVAEVNGLATVIDNVTKKWSTKDVIVLGDLNADCKYFPKKAWKTLPLRNNNKYFWPINDDVDTTTGNTDCAYDRFILIGPSLISTYIDKSAGVFRFDKEYALNKQQALAVSDHYPIELELAVRETLNHESGDEESGNTDTGEAETGCAGRLTGASSGFCVALFSRLTNFFLLRNGG